MALSGADGTRVLRKALELECEQRLAQMGFHRGRKPSLLVDLSPGYQGVFIPIWKSYSQHVVVSLHPNVGVIDVGLEADIAERGGRPVPLYATYQTPLENLIRAATFPQGTGVILFDAGAEARRVMDWFIDAVRSAALPWMARYADDNLLAAEILRLDDLPGTAGDFQIGMDAPLLELRFGRPDRALARLNRHVAALRSRHDAIGDRYRAFAANILAEVDAHPGGRRVT